MSMRSPPMAWVAPINIDKNNYFNKQLTSFSISY